MNALPPAQEDPGDAFEVVAQETEEAPAGPTATTSPPVATASTADAIATDPVATASDPAAMSSDSQQVGLKVLRFGSAEDAIAYVAPRIALGAAILGVGIEMVRPGHGVGLALLTAAVSAATVGSLAASEGRLPPPARTISERHLEFLGFAATSTLLASVVVDAFAAAAWLGLLDFSGFSDAVLPPVAGLAGFCLALAVLPLLLGGQPGGMQPSASQRTGVLLAAGLSAAGLMLAVGAASGFLGPVHGVPVVPADALLGLNLAAGAALAGSLAAHRVPTPLRPRHGTTARTILHLGAVGFAVVAAITGLVASGGASGDSLRRVVPPLLLLVAFFLIAATLVTALQARRAKPVPLYVQRLAPERRMRWALALGGIGLALSVGIPAVAILAGKISAVPGERGLELLLLAPLLGLLPTAAYDHWYEARRIRLEDHMPDLLRDLAASRKSGLTLPKACIVATKGNYDALSPEVRRMADEVSWGESFEDSLDRLGNRVGTSGVRAVSAVVREASASGGEVHDVLRVVSEQGREARELEAERRRGMSLYIAVLYVAFFVFLAILLLLDVTFLPAMAKAGASVQASSLSSGGNPLGMSAVDLGGYRRFFLVAAWVQGVGDGVVAGVMSTGRLGTGLKHAVGMGLIAVLTFVLLPVR